MENVVCPFDNNLHLEFAEIECPYLEEGYCQDIDICPENGDATCVQAMHEFLNKE